MNEKLIELNNVYKSYSEYNNKKLLILKNINFTILKGEKIAIVGESGSGKSSFLNIVSFLDNDFTGKIFFKDKEIDITQTNYLTKLRLENFGFVYQDHHLLVEFNCYENVAIPLLIKGYSKKYSFDLAYDILSKLGLKNRVNHLPGEISGGEKQKLSIARAIISNPSIIFADEPTGSLDFYNAHKIEDFFLTMVKQYNTSLVLVTHNMELAKRMDKVFKIENMVLEQVF